MTANTSVMILRVTVEHAAFIARCHAASDQDGAPVDPSALAKEIAAETERWSIATANGAPAGCARLSPAWWTDNAAIGSIDVRVLPQHRRAGVGRRLIQHLVGRANESGYSRLLAWIRADDAGAAVAERFGFAPTGQVIIEYRLDTSQATLDDAFQRQERLHAARVRIARLDQLDYTEPVFETALYRLWAGVDDAAQPSAAWRSEVIQGSGLSPATHWVALDAGMPIGMTFLRRLTDDTYENDYTAVAPSHRRQGIATALKLEAILAARQRGIHRLLTSSLVENEAMIAVNRSLGYRPGVRRAEVAADIDASNHSSS